MIKSLIKHFSKTSEIEVYEFVEYRFKSNYVSSTTNYTTVIDHTYEEERTIWNTSIVEICKNCEKNNLESVLEYISRYTEASEINKYILQEAQNAYVRYKEDNDLNHYNKLPEPSTDSLYQLIRFIPEINRLHHSVYIDEASGCFGVTLKSSKRTKPILNLLMKENKEVIFSFIKKGKGMIKITGRAFFNHNLEDSNEINNLLRMIK